MARPGSLCALVVIALMAAGCADADTEVRNGPRCVSGPGKPIALEKAKAVLIRSGYSVETERERCIGPHTVGQLTNTPIGNGVDSDEVEREQGHVICHVGDGRAYLSSYLGLRPIAVRKVHYETDYETRLTILNLSCAIYPAEDAYEAQVRRLADALRSVAAHCKKNRRNEVRCTP